ncbi:MAG: hypothetical protein M3H12_03435, partial [Chromatiales bacterium]
GSHGKQAPIHHFATRVMLREDATDDDGDDLGCDIWVTLFDETMKHLVSYKPVILAVMAPEQRRLRLTDLIGTELSVTLRKSTWSDQASYSVRDLAIIVESGSE